MVNKSRSPNWIGTSLDKSSIYVSMLPPIPPIVMKPPTTTIENSLHKLSNAKVPAPLQPSKTASVHASKTAVDRLKELFSRFL